MPIFGLMTQNETKAAIENATKAAVEAALKQAANDFPRWLLDTAQGEQYATDNMSAYEAQADLYRKLSWVTSACEITAKVVALAEFEVKRISQSQEPKDIPNHPFELLLRRPNPMDSRYEFLMATVIFYMLNGNAYWWLNRADEFSQPDEIWFIPPHMIKPWPDDRMFLSGYFYYPPNGKEDFIPAHEIVHFKRPNPFSRYLGMSAIESIARVARGDIAMQEWNDNLFGGANGISGILAFKDQIADPIWNKIKADKKTASERREMMMLRGVGQGGVDWMQNAISQRDMEFLEGRDFNKREIWDVLAPGLVSMMSENATEANSRTGKSIFQEFTVFPIHKMMGEKITNDILPAYPGRPLMGCFEDVRVTDRALELQEIETYAETHTIDEIRVEKYGDDPIGDERGKLFVAQIKPESGGIQEPEPPKVTQQSPTGGPAGTPSAENVQKQADNVADAEKREVLREELDKYQRKALKKVGKRVDFLSDILPTTTLDKIAAKLEGLTSETAVKALFDAARMELGKKPEAPKPTAPAVSDLLILARSLDNFTASAMKAQVPTLDQIREMLESATKTQQIIYQPPTIVNNPPDNVVTFAMPTQEAPQTNITFSPTVAAAKSPDVHIDNPVHIHQNVEAAPAPVNNLTIQNNLPEQLAPVTNLTLENKIPEQPAPSITIQNNLPEQAAPTVKAEINVPQTAVTVNVDPTPIQNNIEVKTPKLKRSKDKVERDDEGISGKTTDYEYEE